MFRYGRSVIVPERAAAYCTAPPNLFSEIHQYVFSAALCLLLKLHGYNVHLIFCQANTLRL
jgi:hypothetical protein